MSGRDEARSAEHKRRVPLQSELINLCRRIAVAWNVTRGMELNVAAANNLVFNYGLPIWRAGATGVSG